MAEEDCGVRYLGGVVGTGLELLEPCVECLDYRLGLGGDLVGFVSSLLLLHGLVRLKTLSSPSRQHCQVTYPICIWCTKIAD